jgi:hypothetical protein
MLYLKLQMAKYPWDKCISDATKFYRKKGKKNPKQIAQKVCAKIKRGG